MLGVYKKILSYVPKEKYLAYIGIILSMIISRWYYFIWNCRIGNTCIRL